MGIAGFFLWLKQYYSQCIQNIPQPVVDAALKHKSLPDSVATQFRYDNLYIDMNGLLHPCCHDSFPLPEPKSEEEMFQRMFDQLDLLVKVVRPRKCFVLCVDGVAPRSKMNQQRSRRFRSVDERAEGDAIVKECADAIESELGLPRPDARAKWDHNVITPATEFMDRMGLAVEWYVMKKLNEDPAWRHLTVVYSDAHAPGEGEHKIMQYIRGLRSQPGYQPTTSHVIHGMDADLICLGLSLHQERVSILRNQLTETFQPDHNRFCYFNLHTYRAALKADFENIPGMHFERLLDDFVYLCFFVGNDFLPHIPLVSIKTQGIELLLDHYVRHFKEHGYITDAGCVNFEQLALFLNSFLTVAMPKLRQAYNGVQRAKRRAVVNVDQRVTKLRRTLALLKRIATGGGGGGEGNWNNDDEDEYAEAEDPDVTRAVEAASEFDRPALAAKILTVMADMKKEHARFVGGVQALPFSYLADDYRDAYYQHKFGWDSADAATGGRAGFERQVAKCCGEYFRGTQWVMWYYTRGCPSWEWYYPYHYAPLLQDLAGFKGAVDVAMRLSAPLHPVEQLLAVLPRQSVHGLPEALHAAVLDPSSVLGPFYPEAVDVDFSEANFSYQGVLRLPFIDCKALGRAAAEVARLEPDTAVTLIFCHESNPLAKAVSVQLAKQAQDRSPSSLLPITQELASRVPIAGRIGRYEAEWPLHAKIKCLDADLARSCGADGAPISDNSVRCFRYEMDAAANYRAELLGPGGKSDQRGPAKKVKGKAPADDVAAAGAKDKVATTATRKRSRSTSPSPAKANRAKSAPHAKKKKTSGLGNSPAEKPASAKAVSTSPKKANTKNKGNKANKKQAHKSVAPAIPTKDAAKSQAIGKKMGKVAKKKKATAMSEATRAASALSKGSGKKQWR